MRAGMLVWDCHLPASPTFSWFPADLPKPVVSLDPPYDKVLTKDSVTLKCQVGHSLGNNSTQWFHNGSLLSTTSSSYSITSAQENDTGEYRYQKNSLLSDPVHLEVEPCWFVLQSPRWVFQEGETIQLRCHSWENRRAYRVSYLRNGKVLKYFHSNSDFSIPEAKQEHSGSYYCRGIIGQNNKSSNAVNILVQESTIPPDVIPRYTSNHWPQIIFYLVMGFLFAVDTALCFFVWKELQSSVVNSKNVNVPWSQDPHYK
ncbi:Low affinity immunoglobulin gamma Fc region receptor IV [Galemys pyrenaicus]|nr:Low affinity immunoglobulin gamma Fc region receptor IV [Galemys pyrenaicus]